MSWFRNNIDSKRWFRRTFIVLFGIAIVFVAPALTAWDLTVAATRGAVKGLRHEWHYAKLELREAVSSLKDAW